MAALDPFRERHFLGDALVHGGQLHGAARGLLLAGSLPPARSGATRVRSVPGNGKILTAIEGPRSTD